MKSFLLFLSIAWSSLAFASTTSVVIPSNVNPALIVQVGKSDGYTIMGYASTKAVKKYLKGTGYKPMSIAGRTPVALGVTLNDDFIGCGCPKAFKEFMLIFSIKSKKDGSWRQQVVPVYSMTNHPQRRLSMGTKFGTILELGEPGHLGNRGFYLKDLNGHTVIEAYSDHDLPVSTHPVKADYGFHSMGGMFEGVQAHKTFYRIAGPTKSGYRLFSKRHDVFNFDPTSELGLILTQIHFKPWMWQTSSVRDGRAWIPPQQSE